MLYGSYQNHRRDLGRWSRMKKIEGIFTYFCRLSVVIYIACMTSQSEICNFHDVILANKNIPCCQISMNALMEKCDRNKKKNATEARFNRTKTDPSACMWKRHAIKHNHSTNWVCIKSNVQLLTFLAARWSIPRDIWKANDIKSLMVTAWWHSVFLVDFVFMTEGLLLRKNSRRLPCGAYSTTTYRKSAPRRQRERKIVLCISNFVWNVNHKHLVHKSPTNA